MFQKVKNLFKNFFDRRNKKYVLTILITLFTICFFVFDLGGLLGKVFTSISNLFSNVEGEVKQIVITTPNYDSNESGSAQLITSADWVDKENVTLSLELSTNFDVSDVPKDIVLVLDTSISMKGSKLNNLKNESKELIDLLLLNSNNKLGIITFNDTAQILSSLTNDKDSLINIIDALESGGDASNYQALKKVEELLNGYQISSDRDLIIMFVTDGYPSADAPNHIAQYNVLKSKYPNSVIYGIAYESNNVIAKDLADISDYQIVSKTGRNALLEPALNPSYYVKFEIIEYIDNDYFYVDTPEDITVSLGTVQLITEENTQKIVWTVSDETFRTGRSTTMSIDLKIKSNLIGIEGLYPILKKTKVSYNLLNNDSVVTESTETPILKNGYKVSYDANIPSGCTQIFDLEEIYYPGDVVVISSDELGCNSFKFQGWKIVNNVEQINDISFKMPSNDVTLKGKWSKLYVDKAMTGSVFENSFIAATFEYTGDYQEFVVPHTGTYKIELWGASGGDHEKHSYEAERQDGTVDYRSSTGVGGQGGYTSGEIKLEKGQKLYVYVGEQGQRNLKPTYNGGASGAVGGTKYTGMDPAGRDDSSGNSGGGATDIRLVAGEWNNFDSLKSRIMVAAGGGGVTDTSYSNDTTVSNAGGLTGYDGGYYSGHAYASAEGHGGTQTAGGIAGNIHFNATGVIKSGSFGYGGSTTSISSTLGAGGGGGGYYGGGGASGTLAGGIGQGGGGGSSFISGHVGCDAITESSTYSSIVHTGQSKHYSNYIFTNTVMIDGGGYNWTTKRGSYVGMPSHDGNSTMDGNIGHGYAKITFIE